MKFKIKIVSSVAFLCLLLLCFGCQEEGIDAPSIFGIPPVQTEVSGLRTKAIGIVKNGLKHNDPEVRSYAIEVASTTGQTNLMPYVTGLLRSKSVPVRFSAAMAVGEMRYSDGEFAVKRLLKDSDENVRIAASFALTKLGRTGLSDNIREGLKSRNQTIRANAALLLGRLGDKTDIDLLHSLIKQGDSADKVKLLAVESIAMLGGKEIYRSKLWPLLISKYADDRVFGIKAMGHLRNRNAKNAISTMLHDDVPEVRLAAAGELGKFGDKRGASEVEAYLKGGTAAITEQGKIFAIIAIGTIKDPGLTKYLPKLLEDRSQNVKLTSAQAVLLISQ